MPLIEIIRTYCTFSRLRVIKNEDMNDIVSMMGVMKQQNAPRGKSYVKNLLEIEIVVLIEDFLRHVCYF